VIQRLQHYLSLVKFSHTVFALPFAMAGFVLGMVSEHGHFSWTIFLLVLSCMVFARSAAMAFNRFIDRQFDAKNPRTATREIPAGTISPNAALALVLISSAAFMLSSYFINLLCFYLSPIALVVILGYSYTKRFTPLCHLVLGLGLALAPIGAYIAVTNQFALLPILFSAMVFFWVSGFDIIYALQDDEFDRSQQLNSIPVYLGRKNALLLSRIFHVIVASLVVVAAWYGGFGLWYAVGAALFISLLIYQHLLVKPDDLSKVTLAFGTTNGVASVIFGLFVCTDLLIRLI
jgi:4-hydroxybenzoate polyprenyltransferase